MRILSPQELVIEPIIGADDGAIPKSTIVRAGKATGKTVGGSILEAAVICGDRYLLFLTDDIPSEDMLSISLLDGEFNTFDSVVLGAMYSTGSFSSLLVTEPNILSFRFIGNTTWKVELLDGPTFCIPILSEPKGVSRRFGFTRHFKIHGNPMPETTK